MGSRKRKLLRIREESLHDRKNLGKNVKAQSMIEKNPEGRRRTGRNLCRKASRPQQAEEWAGTHESFAHMHTYIHAYIHTCIHKANIFFSEKFNKADLHEMGARYTVFCGSQELKPPRHEESKGGRSRQGGEPRLWDRTLGARSAKN